MSTDVETIDAEVVEEISNLPAIRAAEAMVTRAEVSVDEIVLQHEKIVTVMEKVMREGIHFGKIPGVNKPTLLKPGAEVLNVTLRLAPDYESEKFFSDDGHLTVTSKCTLRHITTGLVIASGEGLCSTREQKYAYRQGMRSCPKCGAAAIVRSTRKKAYFCIGNEGGCGERFAFGSEQAKALDAQDTSRVPNPDLPDQWNTVLKMADKRALVAAVLNGTAASDVFTQDAEDMQGSAQPAADVTPAAQAAATTTRTSAASSGFELPSSWPKVQEAIEAYGPQTWEDWLVFSDQARMVVFGGINLEREHKAELRRLSAIAAKALRDDVDAAEFPPPNREQMRKAWLVAIPEHVLEGPSWSMSPDETGYAAR